MVRGGQREVVLGGQRGTERGGSRWSEGDRNGEKYSVQHPGWPAAGSLIQCKAALSPPRKPELIRSTG